MTLTLAPSPTPTITLTTSLRTTSLTGAVPLALTLTRYEGALGEAVLEGVRCGVVRELVCRGKASELAAHFDCLMVSQRPLCLQSGLGFGLACGLDPGFAW